MSCTYSFADPRARRAKDVAILKVQTRNAPTLLVGDDSTVKVQDEVYAAGYPGAADDLADVLDEKAMLVVTITDGNVSALEKSADGVPVIQATTIISSGNSGGPALNEKGEVIGLATFKFRPRDTTFLVPARRLSTPCSTGFGTKCHAVKIDGPSLRDRTG